MKIFSKLMLALLLTSLLILSLIFAAVQWSFDRGMLDYVNQKQLESLQLLSDNLARFYQQKSSWQSLLPTERGNRNNRAYQSTPRPLHSATWQQILRLSEQGIQLPDDVVGYLQQHQFTEQFIPPRAMTRDKRQSNQVPPSPQHRLDLPPPRNENNDGLRPALLNDNKEVLFGRFNANFSVKSIELNGQIIGYLALPPMKHLSDAFDLTFIEQTQKNLLYIFCAVFLLIILIAIPLSRHFIMPIKRLERSMRRLNKGDFKVKLTVKGKDELASLSLHFNDLAETLAQNSSSRKRWLADISHELRTPIAIIKGEIEAIEDGIRPFDQQSLTSLAEEVVHLQKLVNDLTELSNAEIGAISYHKTSINLTELLKQNVLRHQHFAKEVHLTLSCDFDEKALFVWADDTRINQLLDNLINNSIKYTQAPGHILVTLLVNEGMAAIIIDDTFPNVPEDSIDKLFEHLYRVENSRNRKTGGSGLGLALCKNIVQAHHGEISAGHSSHGGLRICCKLPLVKQ